MTWNPRRYGTVVLASLTLTGALWFNRTDNPKIKPVDWYELWMGVNERIYMCQFQGDSFVDDWASTNYYVTNDCFTYTLTTDPVYWISNQIQTNAAGEITNTIPHSNLYYIVSATNDCVYTLGGYVDGDVTLQNVWYDPLANRGVPWYVHTNTFVPDAYKYYYWNVHTNADGSVRTNAAGDWIVDGAPIQSNQVVANPISRAVYYPMYKDISDHLLGMTLFQSINNSNSLQLLGDDLWADYTVADTNGLFLNYTSFHPVVYTTDNIWSNSGSTGTVSWSQSSPIYSSNSLAQRWRVAHELKWRMYHGIPNNKPDDPYADGIGFDLLSTNKNEYRWDGYSTNSLADAISDAMADTPTTRLDVDESPHAVFWVQQSYNTGTLAYAWDVSVYACANNMTIPYVNTNVQKDVDFYMRTKSPFSIAGATDISQYNDMNFGYSSNQWEYLNTSSTNYATQVYSDEIGSVSFPTFSTPTLPSATNIIFSMGWEINWNSEAGGVAAIIKPEYLFITNNVP